MNKPVEDMEQINAFAQNYLDEFIQSSSSPVPPQADRPIISWRAPSQCQYKFNYDGAVFRDRGEAGLGVVVRDARELPMASLVQ
jgi:hypothetical protein